VKIHIPVEVWKTLHIRGVKAIGGSIDWKKQSNYDRMRLHRYWKNSLPP
jgi:hypothetical protein